MYTLTYDDGVSIDGEETKISPLAAIPKSNQDDNASDYRELVGPQVLARPVDGNTTAQASTTDEHRSIRIHNKMLINVRVYAMSDKFDVPGLRPLAQSEFNRTVLLGGRPYYGLTAIVIELLRLTPASDTGFRKVALELCSAYVRDLLSKTTDTVGRGDWETILKRDVDFLFKLLLNKF